MNNNRFLIKIANTPVVPAYIRTRDTITGPSLNQTKTIGRITSIVPGTRTPSISKPVVRAANTLTNVRGLVRQAVAKRFKIG